MPLPRPPNANDAIGTDGFIALSAEAQEQRRRVRRAAARRAILDATESLLLEAGYEGFSMRRLVERCGYTAPTIYHHFRDKEGLIDALLEERFAVLVRRLRRVRSNGDPEGYLRAVGRALVRFGLRNPTHYQLLSIQRARDSAPPPSLEEAREHLEQVWMELWEAGRLRAGDVASAAQSFWALTHGLISVHLLHPDGEFSKTLIDDALDALLRGLVAPAPRQRRGAGRRAKESKGCE